MDLNTSTFSDALQVVLHGFLQLDQHLKKEQEEFKREKEEWESKRNIPISGKIVLDVGGEKFATTQSALISQPGFFRVMFSGKIQLQKDSEGCYFIDREPTVFRHIINYLRGQPLQITDEEIPLLRKECEFYELEGLSKLLKSTENAKIDKVITQTKYATTACRKKADGSQSTRSVWRAVKPLKELYRAERRQLKESKEKFKKEKESFQRLEIKIKICSHADKVKLDVGGKIFTTAKKTLTRTDGFFKTMFGGKFETSPQEDGSFFIDRDWFTFHHILNYLRTGRIEDVSEAEKTSLLLDADYYNLPSLSIQLGMQYYPSSPKVTSNWNLLTKGVFLELSNTNTTATKTCGGYEWNAASLGEEPVTSVTYRVDNRVEGNLMVGLASKSEFRPNGENYNRCGFFMYIRSGVLFSHMGYGQTVFHEIANGSTIEIFYDKENQTVLFGVDRSKPSVEFTNVTGDLYPAVDFYDQSATVTILDTS